LAIFNTIFFKLVVAYFLGHPVHTHIKTMKKLLEKKD